MEIFPNVVMNSLATFGKKIYFCKMFFFNEKIKVEKKLDHHIHVELCEESIFRNLGAILQSFLYDIAWKIKFHHILQDFLTT